MVARTDLHDDAGQDPVGRRFAKIAVTALAIGAFATAGLSGALAQMDDDDGVFGSGGSGGGISIGDDDNSGRGGGGNSGPGGGGDDYDD